MSTAVIQAAAKALGGIYVVTVPSGASALADALDIKIIKELKIVREASPDDLEDPDLDWVDTDAAGVPYV